MHTFAFAVVAATVAAESLTYGAPTNPAWVPALAARDDCAKPTNLCTGAVEMYGTTTTLTYQCASKSQSTTHVTVTNTVTVTATPGAGAPPAKGPPPASSSPIITTTVLSTQTKYTTVTSTVQKVSKSGTSTYRSIGSTGMPFNKSGTSTYRPGISTRMSFHKSVTSTNRPSASTSMPFRKNGTSTGYASPTLQIKLETAKPSVTQFTGAAGQTGVSVAALFLGLFAAAQLI